MIVQVPLSEHGAVVARFSRDLFEQVILGPDRSCLGVVLQRKPSSVPGRRSAPLTSKAVLVRFQPSQGLR